MTLGIRAALENQGAGSLSSQSVGDSRTFARIATMASTVLSGEQILPVDVAFYWLIQAPAIRRGNECMPTFYRHGC